MDTAEFKIPKTPKWFRYGCTGLLYAILFIVYAALCVRCIKIGMIGGGIVFGVLFVFCIAALVFLINSIHRNIVWKTGKKKIWKCVVIGCTIVLLVVTVLLPSVLSVIVYEENFGHRFETYAPLAFHVSDFDGLQVTECTFPSNKGQMLAGYIYTKGDGDQKGVVVLAHGFGGGGHNSYMDIVNLFASNNYLVFAYDATANDKSEGDAAGGLPQGVIDLDYALRFVKNQEQMKDLPILLFGHSWGGYSVSAVLSYHPDVKAIVSGAGFDTSMDMMEAQGREIAGGAISVMLPYLSLYEMLKFGTYADAASLRGFANTDAHIMIIHSADDTTVPPSCGYDKYIKQYKDDPRFVFVHMETKGHNRLFCSPESIAYKDAFNEAYQEYAETLDIELTEELRAEYIYAHYDVVTANTPDEELFGKILAFYDASINE